MASYVYSLILALEALALDIKSLALEAKSLALSLKLVALTPCLLSSECLDAVISEEHYQNILQVVEAEGKEMPVCVKVNVKPRLTNDND